MKVKQAKCATMAVTIALSTATSANVMAEDSFLTALAGGEFSFSARTRYENVEQQGKKEADALTLRTTLAYNTAAFHGFTAFAEVEDISDLGRDDYNDTISSAHLDRAVIADPENTGINQAYLQYQGFATEFKLGRQEISYRSAPFHRFIGNVLWRQNHQSFDGFSLQNKALENTQINYAYLNRQNTIFGDNKNVGSFIKDGQIDMSSHLINVQYTGADFADIEAYAYLVDYDDRKTASSQTFGLRLSASKHVNEQLKLSYNAEVAEQSGYKSGTMDGQNYYLAELGSHYKGWLVKLSYELQQGDGTDSFKTALGTNHAFQGWADQFLNTPAQGLQDIYLTVSTKLLGAKVIAVYHDFATDKSSLDAGSELDLLVQKTFKQHYTLGMKYADYQADKQFTAVDSRKFWLYGQLKF